MPELTDLSRMVRPWWRGIDGNGKGSHGDHIYRDCEWLAEEGDPREGVGWLNPHDPLICLACLRRYDPDEHWKRTSDEY